MATQATLRDLGLLYTHDCRALSVLVDSSAGASPQEQISELKNRGLARRTASLVRISSTSSSAVSYLTYLAGERELRQPLSRKQPRKVNRLSALPNMLFACGSIKEVTKLKLIYG